MKKILLMMAVSTLLVLGGCGDKGEPETGAAVEESTMEEQGAAEDSAMGAAEEAVEAAAESEAAEQAAEMAEDAAEAASEAAEEAGDAAEEAAGAVTAE